MTPSDSDFLFYSTVDDDLYTELSQLAGEQVVHLAVWEDSMVDALASQATPGGSTIVGSSTQTFDMDLYLEGGVYFELYSVAAYANPESDPYSDRSALEEHLLALMAGGLTLAEVAVDEEDALVLVLGRGSEPSIYLAVGGWVLEEWDELPV